VEGLGGGEGDLQHKEGMYLLANLEQLYSVMRASPIDDIKTCDPHGIPARYDV
jgi:hypothetical protein